MTLLEKARELVDKMAFEVCKTDAKKCALIAIEEILNAIYNEDFDGHLIDEHDAASYWQQVKQEIEKL
jgi:hypothetical protein